MDPSEKWGFRVTPQNPETQMKNPESHSLDMLIWNIISWSRMSSGYGRWDIKSNGLFLSLKEFVLLDFGLAWDLSSLSYPNYSHLERKYLSCASSIIVFWKHITCLLSQFIAGEECCHMMNCTPSLTYMWFRCLGEILTFGPENLCYNELKLWGFWNGIDVVCFWEEHEFWETRGRILWIEYLSLPKIPMLKH